MKFSEIPAECTHIAFADESSWNEGRFRSISVVSARVSDALTFHVDLNKIREEIGTSEFKWHKPAKRHGIAIADFFFSRHNKMRVDTLVWDTEDPRHAGLRDRDDKANFARMYYHLLHYVLKRCWPDGACWLICPDEQEEIDWLALEQCLSWKSWAIEESLFTVSAGIRDRRLYYNISDFKCISSRSHQLVQVADMFAGLAVYSYASFEKYQHWMREQNENLSLFKSEGLPLSNSDKERLPILKFVREQAGKRKFQVSLESSSGLNTKSRKSPLNFWLYVPQRINDKAPVRSV